MENILKNRLHEDLKEAMRAKDKTRVATMRLIMAAIKQKEVDERCVVDDKQILAILNKMVKERRDAIEKFVQGNRLDLVEKEEAELNLIKTYLPEQLTESNVVAIIRESIEQCSATSIKDMGKVMAIVKDKVQGRADLSLVSKQVRTILMDK